MLCSHLLARAMRQEKTRYGTLTDRFGGNTSNFPRWKFDRAALQPANAREGASNELRNRLYVVHAGVMTVSTYFHSAALFRPERERDTWDSSSLSKLGINRFRSPGFQQQVKNRYIRCYRISRNWEIRRKRFFLFFFRVEKRVAREKFFIRAKCDTLIPISFQLCWTEEW